MIDTLILFGVFCFVSVMRCNVLVVCYCYVFINALIRVFRPHEPTASQTDSVENQDERDQCYHSFQGMYKVQ